LGRVLDASDIAFVLERLGNVLWMATSDVRALNVARDWSDRRHGRAVPRESGSHPMLASPRSPMPPRPAMPSGVSVRRSAPTMQSLPRASALAAPTCVLVLSLDAALVAQTTREIGGRCSVLAVATPADLARASARAGERPVVLVDTTLPSIDPPTFVGLCPILPESTRVVLWGADARQLARLASRFPRAATWIASGDAHEPGLLALSLV
jgi:hypothetical protein